MHSAGSHNENANKRFIKRMNHESLLFEYLFRIYHSRSVFVGKRPHPFTSYDGLNKYSNIGKNNNSNNWIGSLKPINWIVIVLSGQVAFKLLSIVSCQTIVLSALYWLMKLVCEQASEIWNTIWIPYWILCTYQFWSWDLTLSQKLVHHSITIYWSIRIHKMSATVFFPPTIHHLTAGKPRLQVPLQRLKWGYQAAIYLRTIETNCTPVGTRPVLRCRVWCGEELQREPRAHAHCRRHAYDV